jgi:hypothetical protein
MKLSQTIATLAALLLSAFVHASKETTSLRRGLRSGNRKGVDNYFALISNADQEVPACMSSAVSSGNVVATVRDHLFCIKLSYDGFSGPDLVSHVHGPAGVDKVGTIIFTIDTITGRTQCSELTKDQKKDLDDELWYVNIYSETCPNGAIRGQILPRQKPAAEDASVVQI